MFHTDEYEYLIHEIKNDVYLVGGSLQLIANQHPEVHKFRYWDDVVTDVSHLLGMCREISASRLHKSIQTELLNPISFFNDLQDSATALLKNGTTCIFIIEETLPAVHIDPVRMRHALINLIKNSAEAIDAKSMGAAHTDAAKAAVTSNAIAAKNAVTSNAIAAKNAVISNAIVAKITGQITVSVTTVNDPAIHMASANTTNACAASAKAVFNGTIYSKDTSANALSARGDSANVLSAGSDSVIRHKSLRIQIQDNGCGIPPESLDKIFLPSFTNKPGGTGLGLSIARQIIEAHEGTIHCESIPDSGTTFTILLPAG